MSHVILTSLPANVKAGNVDNGVVCKLEDETHEFVDNSDVFPEPTGELLLTITLASNDKVTLRGYITGCKVVDIPNMGVDFKHSFVAKQAKVEESDQDFSGVWNGEIQYSKFRWVLTELSNGSESEFEVAKAAFDSLKEQVDPKHMNVRTLIEIAKAIGSSDYIAAISKLTLALSVDLAIDHEEEDSKDRLEIFALRNQYAYEMKAYLACIRDAILIERIYGTPIEVIHDMPTSEVDFYFNAKLRRSFAYEKIGKQELAAHGYLAIMILKALTEEDKKLPEDLITKASEALKAMDTDPNTVSVYGLKIQLKGTNVWRTAEFLSDTRLEDVREYLYALMGWCGAQDSEFRVFDHGVVKFTEIPEEFEEDEEPTDAYDEYDDESFISLEDLISNVGESFQFFYEDNKWEHEVSLVSIRQEILKDEDEEGNEDPSLPQYPRCLAGSGACPPEELGGPEGYKQFLLSAVKNEKTERFDGRLQALEYAAENIGFTNSGLDTWGGVKGGKAIQLNKSKDKIVELTEDEEEGDVNEGGWVEDSFNVEEVNEALTTLVGLQDLDDDDDEDEEEDPTAE